MLTLESNTISEFHGSLMTYYELVKVKQKEHAGNWIRFQDALKIPDIKFSKQFAKDKTILRERDWGTKIKWRDTLLSMGFNKENTKMYCVDHDHLEPTLMQVLKTLPLYKPVFSLNIQPPGSVVPAHEDTWRVWNEKYPDIANKYTFEDTTFYIVFLQDQEIGHTFSAGSEQVEWKKGDVIEMPYYCKHATSNAGMKDKLLVQCLGIREKKLVGNKN